MPTAQYRRKVASPHVERDVNNDNVDVPNKSMELLQKESSNDNTIDNDDDSPFVVGAAVTNSNDEVTDENDNAHENDAENDVLIIGTSSTPLLNDSNDDDSNASMNDKENIDAAGKCWSCFLSLNNTNNGDNNNNNGRSTCFTTHEHPLLSIATCAICHDRAEAVESHVIDVQLNNSNDGVANDTEFSNDAGMEVTACSWCGLEEYDDRHSSSSSLDTSGIIGPDKDIVGGVPGQTYSSTSYLDDVKLGDGGTNELLLCDNCPRGMCVKCTALSLGGHDLALKAVRQQCNDEGESWKCCFCNPTKFLGRLREEYRVICGEMKSDGDGMDVDEVKSNANDDNGSTLDDDEQFSDEDKRVARLIDELTAAENALSTAQQMLSKKEIDQTRHEIESELLQSSSSMGLEDLNEAVELELADYLQKWQREFDLCSDTVVRLQDELSEGGVVQLAQYYKFREEERRGESEEESDDYAKRAEEALNERDEKEEWGRGEFRGSSGYKCANEKVYKLEPEDLDNSNLNEIEDINTLQGQVSQMTSNSKLELTSWRSRTGTTSGDIEMLEKKCVKCEERDLGGLIDLQKLEENCIKENDDIFADDKVEMVVRRKKGGKTGSRVVKQSKSLYARKKQAAKSKRRGRLSGDKKEYQPRLPPQPRQRQDGPPKAKKRAQLINMSSSGTLSGRSSPAMKGLLMGSELASFEDSDVILEVDGCDSRPVSVCQPLASLLKAHQKEGIQFCWKNICHDIMSPDEELHEGVRGAVIAHNMGLGKSFQAVCLLHTLLTHPSLVLPSRNGVGSSISGNSSNRIVQRAMLIAPVNTLANWEQEFDKWMGPNVPAIRFFSWTDFQSKRNVIKEWYEEGGILCCSSDRYAKSCKSFLENDDGKGKDKGVKVPLSEEDLFFRKALFNPGPDIVCLDEVHTMLKSTTSQIYKVLSGVGTKLRLALTGSPIQNNLFEYYRIASWMRPNLLGTESAFEKKYVTPIMDGMAADCTIFQANLQEITTEELHGILSGFIHRRDDAVLRKELPFLQTAIIHVRQSKVQVKLYGDFRKYQKQSGDLGFFTQYHALRPVANHPACLIGDVAGKESSSPDSPTESKAKSEEKESPSSDSTTEVKENEEEKVGGQELGDQPRVAPEKYAWICDHCKVARFRTFDEALKHEETCPAANADTASNEVTKDDKTEESETLEWWRSFADKAKANDFDISAIENGGKIVLLLQILAHCDLIGDKVVVFSQCLSTLTFIEQIIQSDDWGGFKPHLPNNICHQSLGGWKKNYDYVRIDGSVDAKERGDLISSFNSSGNQHTKLFLLSTKAGGLGVNLVAANRVVIFDTHWNPAVDLQAVYRCYRYGQTKPTFCYRLLGEGSMEEKIYSRAATKAALSGLVIDKKNPARSFTRKELDLLQHEDTWLGCEDCGKWRMLPPNLTAEQREAQTSIEPWTCADNIYDEERQCCEAEERGQTWMLKYFERLARQDSQSQSQTEVPANEVLAPSSRDNKDEEKTERDEVLQALLSRTEEMRSVGKKGVNSKSKSSMSWVSKHTFQEEKSADDDSKLQATNAQATAASSKSKATSPKKRASKSSAKRAKSPTIKSGKSPSKKKAKVPPQLNGTPHSEKNGVSPGRIEKYLTPKNGDHSSSADIKAEQGTADEPNHNHESNELSGRKRNPSSESKKKPSGKKRKEEEDVIDLCDSD